MTDWKERAERWDKILPQLPGELFFEYKSRLIEHLEDQLKVLREARKQAEVEQFNAGWNQALLNAENILWQEGWEGKSVDRLRALSKSVSGSPERLEGGQQ
jgi:hypothetical protein